MQSNFEQSCSIAREAIAVPALPLDAIRAGAQRRPSERAGRRRRGAIAAVLAGCSVVAVAAAAEMIGHVQISLQPTGAMRVAWNGTGKHWAPVRNPTDQDFQKAARAMDFPVILPKGLPQGTKAEMLVPLGSGAMQIIYDLPGASRRSNHLLFVTLANPKSIAPAGAKPARSEYSVEFGQKKGIGGRWMVGQEEVILLRSTITAAEFAHFKAAMTAEARRR